MIQQEVFSCCVKVLQTSPLPADMRPVVQTVLLSDDMDAERIYLDSAVVRNSLQWRMLQSACVDVCVLMSVII